MNKEAIKKELHSYIEKADNRFLKMMYALAKNYQDEDTIIVGYEVDGTPITKETLINEVREASEQVKSGKYISQEDLDKEVENW